MNDRLIGIDVFVTAVEAGTFAGAAQRLGLTRSAVAKSVGRLEARLGARLFTRTTRSQSLTDD
ncbi:MAG TPA: LysR family transcriptional regulator, partial [Burkholderiaceae bacterium]